MKTANSSRTPLTTLAFPAILGTVVVGGIASVVATQLGWTTVAWVFWSVNVVGLVLLFLIGAIALTSAVSSAIRNKVLAFTSESVYEGEPVQG